MLASSSGSTSWVSFFEKLARDLPPPAVGRPRATLKSELQPHQARVLRKLKKNHGVLVMHGLGSGKTFTSIAAGAKGNLPMEVVAPAPLVENYEKEVQKHTVGKLPRRVSSYTKLTRDSQQGKGQLNTNALVVLDEAHRLRNPGTARHKHVALPAREAKKRLLLTGTPIYNRPSDLAVSANIAAGEARLPESQKDFEAKFVREHTVNPRLLQRVMGVKPGVVKKLHNKKLLVDALRGHVDLHDGGGEHFPTKHVEHIEVPMGKEQHKVYKYHEGQIPGHIRRKIKAGLPPSKSESKDLNAFMSGVRQSSLSHRPYRKEMTDAEEDSQTPKIQRMVGEVHKHHKKDPNFRGVVYSNYIDSGLMPISRQLKAKGIDHHVFHGGVSRKEKKRMVEDYNAGRKKVLLVSSSGTEGLDLKGTKLMQVAEPHWNNSKIEQVIGRGVRYKSHSHLPDHERHVKVQRYYSTRPQGSISRALRLKNPHAAERWLQMRSDEKSDLSRQFRGAIQEASKE